MLYMYRAWRFKDRNLCLDIRRLLANTYFVYFTSLILCCALVLYSSIVCYVSALHTIKFNTKHNPMRWITWLASRWRAQQSAWTNVICRTHWSSISWTHIAVTVRFRDHACLRVGIKIINKYVKSMLIMLLLGRFKWLHSTLLST